MDIVSKKGPECQDEVCVVSKSLLEYEFCCMASRQCAGKANRVTPHLLNLFSALMSLPQSLYLLLTALPTCWKSLSKLSHPVAAHFGEHFKERL